MLNKRTIDTLTEKEKKDIIKVGKAADRINKYGVKVVSTSTLVGLALLVLGAAVPSEKNVLLILGGSFFVGGFLIIIIWGFLVAAKEKRCNCYSNELYQELTGIETTNNIVFEPNKILYPLTTKVAEERFDGNINEALKYIILNIRGDELDKYIDEWNPEQASYVMDIMYGEAKQRIGDKGVKEALKESVTVSVFSEETGVAEEELASQKNPYKKKLIVHSIILVLLIVLSVVLMVVDIIPDAIIPVLALLPSLVVFDLGYVVTKAIQFSIWKKKQKIKTDYDE